MYLKERSIREEKEKQLQMKENEKELVEKVVKNKHTLVKIDKQLKENMELKHKRERSSDTLLDEADKRLKEALTKNDVEGIQLAQGMVEGALSLRTQERLLGNEVEKLNKRKFTLINSIANSNVK